ncbi:hypothetical protein [Bacillus thuringiensis]|uniref:hypothetical protein n=1 Tax=Bacillus thuringiensis TaxID=1428 RepID=UPI000BECCC89|nr:hypothetical protein [Bacillus thuringiensis]PDY28190.1 hypothetical protein COM85_33010 [Bacillus thuringiensis]
MKLLFKNYVTGFVVSAMSVTILTPSIYAEGNISQNNTIDSMKQKQECTNNLPIEKIGGNTTSNSLQIIVPTSNHSVNTNNVSFVYQDESKLADLAIQITKEGVKSFIHIKNNVAPKEYEFTVHMPNGWKLVTFAEYMGGEQDTGDVFIVDEQNTIQSIFMPSWIKDANGKTIATHYKVNGAKLIQIVDFDKNTAFPLSGVTGK